MASETLVRTLWTENRSKLIPLLVMLGLFAGMLLWQGLWLAPRLELSQTRLAETRNELRLAQQRVSSGGAALISGIAEDLERFYQRIPPGTALGSFIGRLYSYAADAGIDIEKISYTSTPLSSVDLLGYQLAFSVDGSYPEIKKFIHLLENSPSLLILQKIALAEARAEKNDSVGLQMQLQTFFYEPAP